MARYNPNHFGAPKFRPGTILPPEKIKPCPVCGTSTYVTSGNSNWQKNYRALAIKTSKGYVAVPFKMHNVEWGTCGYERNPGLAERTEDDVRASLGLEPRTGLTEMHPNRRGVLDEMVQKHPDKYSYPPVPEQKATIPEESSTPTPAPTSEAKPKGFTNKYAGNCVGCGTRVGVGEGITSKGNAGWEVRCVGCHHG